MQVLIIGSGGREHALAWKVAQSPQVSQVWVAPGNGGTEQEPKVMNLPRIKVEDIPALIAFAQKYDIALTIVGPEVPLMLGIVDQFQAAGLRCFGPLQAAAQLEGSKGYAKKFLQRHHIPTADYAEFNQLDAALAYLQTATYPLVIKADGLAAGKGVVICHTLTEAEITAQAMLSGKLLGKAGSTIIVEEFLSGEEASFMVVAAGEHCVPLATSQDHKTRDAGDTGPNTGGMGAYSPAPVITPALTQTILQTIIEPTLRGMIADGQPYTGFLYAGLMIDAKGNPKVLEFNCRMGDPETQPILLRLKSDLVTLCQAALDQKLSRITLEWDPRPALGVVMASGGYPEKYDTGKYINGLDSVPAGVKVFHAGTYLDNCRRGTKTAGGRVLCVCALGDTVQQAQQRAYTGVNAITWTDCYYRPDIGHRAIARERNHGLV